MKIFLLAFSLSTFVIFASEAQTLDAQYLNPKITTNTDYKFLRFGTSTEHYAGFMWNNSSVNFGNGNDFSIFTYENRDMTIRTGTGNFVVFPTAGGNMGIGTTSPAEKLDVDGNLRLGGDVGITINPNMDVSDLNPGVTTLGASFKGRKWGHVVVDIYGNDNKDAFAVRTDSNRDGILDKIPFLVNNAGKVGIGTVTPDAELAVNGVVHSKEVKVDLNGWSDFVFKEHYNLPTLEEVEQHIKEKGHLKDIPSAKEVEENGIFLGEMDAKLLQKIEELTLYVLELKKENRQQHTRIDSLVEKTRKQQQEINRLKKK